ncbi:MAG: UDP-3-O-acyl-N-acetylglucosamine deacetylase [Thermoguttaceae bacterium]
MKTSILSLSHFARKNGCGAARVPNRHLHDVLRLQRTIASPVAIEGFGFWTGEDVRLEFAPAAPGTGLVFVRTDLPGTPRIPANVIYRDDTKPRQTSLELDGVRVDMIEHVLAALRGLRIDNCEIRVNGAEMPGVDGSSRPFVDLIDRATRVVSQPFVQPVRMVVQSFRVGNDDAWIEVTPSCHAIAEYTYQLQYASDIPIHSQKFTFDSEDSDFRNEVASCRTFLTEREAQHLLAKGLGKRVTYSDILVFGEDGPIGNHLHFSDECARHKVLDMIGDFALAGCDWLGTFTAHRSGHALNAECIRQLFETSLLLDQECLPFHDEFIRFQMRQQQRAA